MNYKPSFDPPAEGDLVFAHTNGLMGRAIRLGEVIRWKRGSLWNHVAIIDRIEGDEVYVIQAEPRGVTDNKKLDEVAPSGRLVLIEPPLGVDKLQILEFARQQVGQHYGFVSILAVIADILTPDWFPLLRRRNSWICSALAGEALRAGGWIHKWADIYTVTPAQLWQALVKPND